MGKRIFVLALALGLIGSSGVLYSATVDDFDLKILPDDNEVVEPGGLVDLEVELTTRIDETQGWSLGVLLDPVSPATAEITALKFGDVIQTLKEGDPAEFQALNYYAATDLATPVAACEPACTGISAGAFNMGVTIQILQQITMPAKPDGIIIAEFTVDAGGSQGDVVNVPFSDDVGDPKIATVIVHGGLSFAPTVQEDAVINLVEPPPCPAEITDVTVDAGYFDATFTFDTGVEASATVTADGVTETSDPATSHTVTLTGLTDNTTYNYTIEARDENESCDAAPVTGTFTTKEAECVPASTNTIDISGGAGNTGDIIEAVVTLNFDALESSVGREIQGWSYGLCIEDPQRIKIIDPEPDSDTARAAALIEGTDSATVKEGGPPEFNVISIYDEGATQGITHAVTIQMMTQIILPERNGYTDMKFDVEILMNEDDNMEGDKTWIAPCNKVLGSPEVENLAVVLGLGDPFNEFEGTLPEKADPAVGCCTGADGACNTPGEFEFIPIVEVPVLAGSLNGDGKVDLADGVYILNWLFREGPPPPCLLAADFNGDGKIDSSDAIASIFYVLQPTENDLGQLTGSYGSFLPAAGPALGEGCIMVLPEEGGLGCEVPNDVCAP